MPHPRLIATVTLLAEAAVKTVSFQSPKYVGDPVNTVSLLSSFEVEELIILDISKSFGKPPPSKTTLSQILENAFMPISFGGGIRTMNDAALIFSLGFDKVILREKLLTSSLPLEIANQYGKQSVVGCLDISRIDLDEERIEVNGNVIGKGEVDQLILSLAKSGIGEVIIQDKNLDGTRAGFESTWLHQALIKNLEIPVVPLGGCKNLEDAGNFLAESNCHSIAASSMFLYRPTRDAILINYPTLQEWETVAVR